jgi:1-acyl-sn-glycerol-3-phosphate acyltransferase
MWLHRVLRWFVGPVFLWWYRLSSENQGVVRELKPPFLVIPNHVMRVDPAVVNYFIPVPVHFLSSDANFRKPLPSFLLRQLGTIPTAKQADDMGSLRLMLKLLKDKKVVGIFAEGKRSWDGASLPIIPSTAKLVKIAKVPVLVSLLKGGYMSEPRWSFHGRRGRVVVEQKLAVTAEQAATLNTGEITRLIDGALAHDDSAFQRQSRRPYLHKRPAETLQLALFYCPECSSLNTMHSEGRRFYCRSCGHEVEFTPSYRFRPASGAARQSAGTQPHFGTIREWSVAQDAFVERHLVSLIETGEPHEVFGDPNTVLYTGYRSARLREQARGRFSFHLDGLRFRPDGTAPERFFQWPQVKALNVVYSDQVEFYFDGTLYVVRFPAHDTSGYKYELCGNVLESIRLNSGSAGV